MALMPMYPGQPNSPQTELAENIDEMQTTIPLLDASVLPPGPNLAVIGGGEHAETVLYESIDGDNLINCTRGFQGVASSWQAGQKVARNFTAYDYDALRRNLESHGSEHNHDGADPIPDLVQLRDDYDALRQKLNSHGSEHNHDGSDPIPDLVQLREGVIVESGENANGRYVRFADGTQICWNGVVFQDVDGSVITYNWVNPAQFLGPVRYFGTIHSVTSSNSIALNRRLARNQNGYVIDPGGETQTINLYTLSIGRWK